ncbi:DUF2461 domain-containing protein [Myroides sp. LJL119]
MNVINKSNIDFLKQLEKNNNRVWFVDHKELVDKNLSQVKEFFLQVYQRMAQLDNVDLFHMHRIYRDVRFSKDKTPYKNYFGLHIARSKPLLRGGYYINIEPNNSFVGGGFWQPNKEDLLRIRKEIAYDSSELRQIITQPLFIEYFTELQGEELKTGPRDFDKNSPDIDLLKKKQFLLKRSFSDQQVTSTDFQDQVIETFLAMRDFFDYMSHVLTTDANGVSLYE